MKIIVFKWKPLLFSGAAAAILVSLFCFAATPKLISAFSSSNGRSLPIYSVQTEEKKIALGHKADDHEDEVSYDWQQTM